jgi:hypothetical protein
MKYKKILLSGVLLIVFSYSTPALAFNPITYLIDLYKSYTTPLVVIPPPSSPITVISSPIPAKGEGSISDATVLSILQRLISQPSILSKLRGPSGVQGTQGSQGLTGKSGVPDGGSSTDTSSFVTQKQFEKQLNGIFNSIENSNDDSTGTAIVAGNAATATALQTARTIGGVSFDGTANITVASATGGFSISGGDLSLGANNLTMTGSLGSTGSRLTKGWFTDLEISNAIVGSVTGNAGTATSLQIPRTIAGVSFNGTTDISIASSNLSDSASIGRTGLLNVRNYGAVGDGVADDTSAITQAIAAASLNNKGVFFPAGSYKITSIIDLPVGVLTLSGEGKELTKFIPSAGVVPFRFTSVGSYTHTTSLTANVSQGAYSVVVNSTTGLSVGQVVRIYDSTQKEFNTIASISGNTIYLLKAMAHNMLVSDGATLGVGMNYTSVSMKDFSIWMPSPGGLAIQIINGYKVRMSDILLDGAPSTSGLLNVDSVSDIVIDKSDFQHAYTEPPLVNGNYGFTISNSNDVSVSNSTISKVGEVYYVGVIRSQFINNRVSGNYSVGFDFHGAGEVSAVISGNVFSGNLGSGIEIWSNTKTASNISITNNVFDSGGWRAIYVNGGTAFPSTDIVIANNVIRNYGNLDPSFRGGLIFLDFVRNVNINNNIISDSNSGSTGAITLHRDVRGVDIKDNRIVNHSGAAISWGDEVQKIKIDGNYIEKVSGGAYVFMQTTASTWTSTSTATTGRAATIAEITTQNPHDFVVGDMVSITGVIPSSPDYNMAFASVLSVPNAYTFTYRLYNDNGGTTVAGSNTTGTVKLTSNGEVDVTNNTFVRDQGRAGFYLTSRLGKFQGNKFSASGMSDNSKQPIRYKNIPSAGYPESFNDSFMWDGVTMGFDTYVSLLNDIRLTAGEQFTVKRKNSTIANLYTSLVKDQSTGGTLYTFPAGNNNGSVTLVYDVNPQTNTGSWIVDDSSPIGSNILVGNGLGGFSTTSSSFINLNSTTGFVGIGTTNPLELLSLGLTGTTKGVLSFAGNTSGKIILQPASDAGTFTLTLPTSDGDPNQVLSTDGSGVLSWVTVATGSVSQTPWASAINAAGFTLNGNSTASGNLTLDSTSDATKGNVLINPTGGNVGIGTATPGSYKLNVNGTGNFNTTVSAGSGFSITNSGGTFGASVYNFYKPYMITTVNSELSTSKSLLFNIDADNSETGQSFIWGHNANGTSATALMTLLDSGYLGVGNTAPGTMLTIGTATTNTGNITVYGTGTTCVIGDGTGGTSCTSDLRLKDNIIDMGSELSHIMALRPVTFNWKDVTRDQVGNMGLIAQEVQAIYPNVVRTIYDDYLGIDYTTLVVPAIKAIQELNLNLEGIAGTITPLEGSMTEAFIATFLNNIKTTIGVWLADMENGIAKIFANNIESKKSSTENLCVKNDSGETCITREQLDALLLNVGTDPTQITTPPPAPLLDEGGEGGGNSELAPTEEEPGESGGGETGEEIVEEPAPVEPTLEPEITPEPEVAPESPAEPGSSEPNEVIAE